jgi:uncharacterized protein (UPF0264 family)
MIGLPDVSEEGASEVFETVVGTILDALSEDADVVVSGLASVEDVDSISELVKNVVNESEVEVSTGTVKVSDRVVAQTQLIEVDDDTSTT